MVYNNNNKSRQSHTNSGSNSFKPKYSSYGSTSKSRPTSDRTSSASAPKATVKYPILAAILILACVTAGCPIVGGDGESSSNPNYYSDSFLGSFMGRLPTFFHFKNVLRRGLGGADSFAAYALLDKKKDDEESGEEAEGDPQALRDQMTAIKSSADHFAVTFVYEMPDKGASSVEVPLLQLSVACGDSNSICRRIAPFAVASSTLSGGTSVATSTSFSANANDNETETGIVARRVSIITSFKGNQIRLSSSLMIPTGGMCESDGVEDAKAKCASLFSVPVGEFEAVRDIFMQEPAIASKLALAFKDLTNEKEGTSTISEHRALTLAAELDFIVGRVCAPPTPILTITKGETSFAFDTPFSATATHQNGAKVRLNFIATECMPEASGRNKGSADQNTAASATTNRSSAAALSAARTGVSISMAPTFCQSLPDVIHQRQSEYYRTDVPLTSARKFLGMVPKRNVESNVLMMFYHLMPSLDILRVQPQTNPNAAREFAGQNKTPPTSKGSCTVYFQTADQANAALNLHKRVYFDVRTSDGMSWLGFWALESLSSYDSATPVETIEVQKQIMRDFSFCRGDDPDRRLFSDYVCKGETNIEDAKNVEKSRNGVLHLDSLPYHSQHHPQQHPHFTNNTAAQNSAYVAISATPPYTNNQHQNTNFNQVQYTFNGYQQYPVSNYQFHQQSYQHGLALQPSRTWSTGPVPQPYARPFAGTTSVQSLDSNGRSHYRHNPYGDMLIPATSTSDSPTLSSASASADPLTPISAAGSKIGGMATALTDPHPTDGTPNLTPSLTDDEDLAQLHSAATATITPLEHDVEVASVNATDGESISHLFNNSRQHSSSMFIFANRQISTMAVNGDGFMASF
eukprot:GILI01003807.1.p1 GENE.GILI01003807.1~~GILI01003807.1.p1  ORF type:complete len:862 (+),score=172.21 GILI01003807.1:198-2783(+)